MGDRGNVAILDHRGQAVVLYTHWGGHKLPAIVKHALAKKARWDDPSYLARIIFDEMTDGQHGDETGFGIRANALDDNEYPVLVIDTAAQRISSRHDPRHDDESTLFAQVPLEEGISLEDFIALSDEQAMDFRNQGVIR